MNLPSNLFNNQTPPQVFLCQPDKTIIGEIQPYDFTAVFKFNTYSETNFTIISFFAILNTLSIHTYNIKNISIRQF